MSSEVAECTNQLSEYLDRNELVRLFRRGELEVDDVLKRISEASPDDELFQTNKDGVSLLAHFSVLGNYEIVEKLLSRGLKPAIIICTGGTLLQLTVRVISDNKRDTERAKILRLYLKIAKDYSDALSVDNQDTCAGWTALNMAAYMNLEKCVEVLLEHGANTRATVKKGHSPLHNAVGNHAIVKMLLNADSANIDGQDEEGNTALSLALKRGDLESTMVLLERKANPNIPNKEGITPLFMAAKMGHIELVKLLVKHGSEVMAQGGEQGITALHWAAHKEMGEVALYLIESGGDVMAKDRMGRTPLSMATAELATKMKDAAQRCRPHEPPCELSSPSCSRMTVEQKAVEACCSGDVRALCVLLNGGVDINHTSGATGASLLHMAAYYGQVPVIMYLFHHGANMKALDKDGDSVLHFACMKNFSHGRHRETVRLLLTCLLPFPNQKNLAGDTPLMTAIRHCFPDRVRLLMTFKADISIANLNNELPLHRAAQLLCSIEVLFYLVENSNDLNPRDNQGATPLMYAVRANCSPAVKYLLQRGADPNLQDSQGHAPILVAAQENNFSICEMLMANGADPNIVGTDRKITPLHVAVHRNCLPIFKVLVLHGGDMTIPDSEGNTPLSIASPHIKKGFTLFMNARKEITSQLREGCGTETVCPVPCNDILSECDPAMFSQGGAPCHAPSTDTPTTGTCHTPSTGTCHAPSTGTCHAPSIGTCHVPSMVTPTTGAPSTATATNGTNSQDRSLPGPADQRSEEQGERSEEQGERSDEQDERSNEQDQGSPEAGVTDDGSIGSCNGDKNKVAKLEKKDTFSKEVEEGGEEDTPITQERYLEMQAELASLAKSASDLQQQLETVSKDNALLIAKNQNMVHQMKRNENVLVTRHVRHAISLSMHVLCGGHMYHDNSIRPAIPAHNMPSPQDVSSCPSYSAQSIDKQPHRPHEESVGLRDGGVTVDEEGRASVGRTFPKFNPLSSSYLQWWMVDKAAIQVDDTPLNPTSASDEKFFDVCGGRFRHMDVVVRRVCPVHVENWSYDQYMTFFHEVNCLSCLHCPYIVQFLCACFDPTSKTCFIVNEYMSHGSLHSVLHEDKLPLEWGTRVSIMSDVCRGLVFLHSHHVIHHCLTPTNILIGKHFNAKINDFGLYDTKVKSQFFADCKTRCPPAYAAPEALENNEFTQATDIYSLGIVMYECAVGEHVFADLQCNPVALVMQVMMGSRPSFPEGVAPAYGTLAETCWTKDPDLRPTAELVATQLVAMTT